MSEPISKKSDFGLSQPRCKKLANLEWLSSNTSTTQLNLADKNTCLTWNSGVQSWNFPRKTGQNTTFFLFFAVGTSRGLLTLLDVLALFQTSPGFALANFWSTKKQHQQKHTQKHPTLQKYLRKNLMKKNSQSKLSNPYIGFDVPSRKTRLFCPFCFRCIDPAGQLPFAKASSRFRWSILDDRSLHWILVKVHVLSQASTSGFENND